MKKQQPKAKKAGKARLIAAIGFGNFLESFDFTVYSYFAPIIGLVILQTEDPLQSTYISTLLFGLGFLARPLGSAVLGAYADKRGRKAALLATVLLMGLGSALIAFAPPYASAGLAAPALVLLGRLLQGFSVGGEIGSAAALLLESAAAKRRGLYVATQFMMQGISAAAGALCAYLLFANLPAAAMRQWGWRLPFLLALLIIPVGLYIRAHIAETLPQRGLSPQGAPVKSHAPLREIWARRRRLLLSVLTVMPVTLLVYTLVIYMPTYLGLIPIKAGAAALCQGSGRFMLTVPAGLLLAAAAFAGGLLCDRLPKRKPLALCCLGAAFIACFGVYASVGSNFAVFLAALCCAIIALGILMTAQALLALEAWPQNLRATGMAVSIALGACLFGGSAQAIITKLMIITHAAPLTPFYYLGPMLLLAIAAYAAFEEGNYS